MAKSGVGGADNLDGGGEPSVDGNAVDVSGELLWKARAQDAEEELEALRARVTELESALVEAEQTIVQAERRGEIDRELTAAKAVDMETARLLTEAVVAEMDEPDVSLAVRELCDRKPFLFACRKQEGVGGVSMSPAAHAGDSGIDGLAQRARSSGERSELLRYLRARRAV